MEVFINLANSVLPIIYYRLNSRRRSINLYGYYNTCAVRANERARLAIAHLFSSLWSGEL